VSTIDAVIISHLHPDHFVDAVSMAYALRFHPDGPQSVDLYGPRGTGEMLTRHLDPESRVRFNENLKVAVVSPGHVIEVGAMNVSLLASNHPAQAMSLRVVTGDRVVAYSGDSGGSDDLVDCARDSDLFVCDATWSAASGPHPVGLHLTGEQAGRFAQHAGAARLLVTHVSPYADRQAVADEAAAEYDGDTLLADDLQEYEL
jgi:ribonuclease BN (tRNA processing enzyme)